MTKEQEYAKQKKCIYCDESCEGSRMNFHHDNLMTCIENLRKARDAANKSIERLEATADLLVALRNVAEKERRVLKYQLADKISELDAAIESAQQLPFDHPDSTQCPTWHDGCHCTVETLRYNIQRAERAEAALERERDAAKLRDVLHDDDDAYLLSVKQAFHDAFLQKTSPATTDKDTVLSYETASGWLKRYHELIEERDEANEHCNRALAELVQAETETERVREFFFLANAAKRGANRRAAQTEAAARDLAKMANSYDDWNNEGEALINKYLQAQGK